MKSDFDLKRDVLSRLELEPKIDAAGLGVSVEGGVVTLRGRLDSEADRASAERVVRFIEGVKGLVDDELQVESVRKPRPQDSELQVAALEAIQWLTTVPPETLKVTARNGWLTLEGVVEFRHQAQSVEQVLREVPGVRGVKNQLVIKTESKAA